MLSWTSSLLLTAWFLGNRSAAELGTERRMREPHWKKSPHSPDFYCSTWSCGVLQKHIQGWEEGGFNGKNIPGHCQARKCFKCTLLNRYLSLPSAYVLYETILFTVRPPPWTAGGKPTTLYINERLHRAVSTRFWSTLVCRWKTQRHGEETLLWKEATSNQLD